MPDRFLQGPQPSLSLTATVTAIGIVLIGLTDYLAGWRFNVAVLQSIPLIISAYGRNRRLIWYTAAAVLVAIFATHYLKLLHTPNDGLNHVRLMNRGLLTLELMLVALLLHMYVGIFFKLETSQHLADQRNLELERSNTELSAREEEIARQNEELQSQTEEFERQSEELQVSNEALSRRERMLETLLSLSRSLAGSTSRQETMDKICQTLGELINGPHTAAAIKVREGDQIRIVCHSGFGPEGPEAERWPYSQSFAQLILERGRTGYIEDINLRPELRIPQPKSGPRHRSVLAAPLRVGKQTTGSLEVYHTDRHTWTEEQVTLIESLAAQTSISLEAAEFVERIDEERRRLRIVLETVPFGVAITDHEAKQIMVNPAGGAMINVAPQTWMDFRSLEPRWKVFKGGQQIPFERRPVVRAVAGEVVHNEELEFMLAGGRRVSVLVSAAPIFGRGEQITGAIVGWTDVTQLKALQGELDARRREAEESSLRKSRFLAAVSHDIRTPANAISLLAELMQRSATTPGMVDEIPEIATDLKRSALTLVNLVSDVLDLTRFDSGKVDLQESVIDVGELIDEECRQLHQAAREKKLEFKCEPPNPPMTVRADRVKLSRVLTNLVSNAIKFTERGEVSVNAHRNGDGTLAISVRDTGCGIPSEHCDRIFDEFFQLKNPERDRDKGSGLGLAICRRLTEAMGGTITLQSEPGKGSTFTVLLPAQAIISN